MKKIVISGVIGWEVTAEDIRDQFSEIGKTDPAQVEINSPGGSVFEGIEISNLFKNHEGPVNVVITGLAASMGSYIAMAGDTISAHEDATFMIHNASTIAWGDHRELRKNANVIESLSKLLSNAYTKQTGKEKSEITGLMDDESWFFGEEIQTAGFVNEIIKTESPEDKNDAVAFQKLVFQDSIKKMSDQAKNKTEIDKLAAYFQAAAPPVQATTPVNEPEKPEPQKEEIKMGLAEFLAANPEAQAEYDQKITAAVGEVAKQRKVDAEKVAPIIMSDNYGKAIKNAGMKVLSGEKSYSNFEDMVAVVDEMNEKEKSSQVQEDQPKSTPGEQDTAPDAKTKTQVNAEKLGDSINDQAKVQ